MGSARGVHNSLKIFYLPGLKHILSTFWCCLIFVFFKISPDPCPKLAKNDLAKTKNVEKLRVSKIFQLFIVIFENHFCKCPIFYLLQDDYIYIYIRMRTMDN